MKINSSLIRLSHFHIPCIVTVSLIMLTWSVPAVCGPTKDTDEAADLANLKAWLKKDPNRVLNKDSSAWTSLHFEARAGHKEAVKLLLAKGANVNARERNGFMLLQVAATKGYKDVVELLLANKAEVNAKNNAGMTPLHWAAEKGHKEVVELLLTNKADVNVRDNTGIDMDNGSMTSDSRPWDVGDLRHRVATIRYNALGGKTPLHLAADLGHKDVVELLRQHGGHEGSL
jgi:ankyrin repeat protein